MVSRSKNVLSDVFKIADRFGKEHPGYGDPSLDVLIHLAIALKAANLLSNQANNLSIIRHIEYAYREILQYRLYMPDDEVKTDMVSRFGRLLDEKQI